MARSFGLTADGHVIEAVELAWPGGLQVEVLTYGAVVRRLGFPTTVGLRQAILGYEALDDYERDTAYVGALVGRVANRIAGGRFPLDGREVQVSVNEAPNTLHGGRVGFSKRIWRLEDETVDKSSVTLAYTSADGEEGFPGALDARAHFSLIESDTLQIDYTAVANAPTVVNLSHHLYFNLLGDISATILGHVLMIEADDFTPVGGGLIPSGAILPVQATPFDLRGGAMLRDVLDRQDAQLTLAGGLDLNWALKPGANPALSLRAPDGASLHLTTDQPGVQVYSGQKLQAPFVKHGALAIEPQGFPDAVNHPGFPDQILRPGETYRRCTRYRLRA
jgi:aldose 1-epimerase